MGRELKRVPLDFDYPMGKIWHGYTFGFCGDGNNCDDCKQFAKYKGIAMTYYDCPDFGFFRDPPTGEGYQLWETTSEGSPQGPVFSTLDELCEWCGTNATTFAQFKATAEQWKQMFEDGFVHHKEGNVICF